MPFIPITKAEALKRDWDELDVIFVTGDAYIDHPAFGVPLLARWLESHGFRVGILPQPDWRDKASFMALGRPCLFFAVSAGAMDSMVAHYTPARKLRRDDAYTPGNHHGSRPNRATIVYTARLKEAYKDVPVVIGGIEASLRRFAHYDFWEDKVRRSILFDSKADLLVYGMGERPLLELAQRLKKGEQLKDLTDIRGTAYASRGSFEPCSCVGLPSYEEVACDHSKYAKAFCLISKEQSPFNARLVAQRHADRLLVCNPPALPLAEKEMDAVYALPFARVPHPAYREPIPAYEQIKASITTHRGCFGGCAFCAITLHQGKTIQSRSAASVLRELEALRGQAWFHGMISDVGGPTANMYGTRCGSTTAQDACRKESCLYPRPCRHLLMSDRLASELLRQVRGSSGIKQVAVASGIRYDLLEHQPEYFRELLAHHVGGLLKVAPEHLVDRVTAYMRKPRRDMFERFLERFRSESARLGKKQYVIPYLISGHPGCTLNDMVDLALILKKYGLRVEQVQDFTPTPGTLSSCMYHTGIDPFTGQELYVARSDRDKLLQKSLLLSHLAGERRHLLEALAKCGRESTAAELLKAPGREKSDKGLLRDRI